ncbi:MAG: protein kinase [Pseudomonadota bacterium]|nr:protein kinase [Pseudomonadota bacterium]
MNPAEAIEHEREPSRAPAAFGRTLSIGSRLRDYEIKSLIAEGSSSIVYLAWDHSLQRKVTVKEYMPASMASRVAGSQALVVASDRQLDTFKAGLKSFVNEARLLARFDHPSLVKVYRFWEENGTAYMVMPFYEGPTLKTALAELGHVPSESELRAWLKPILNAVTVLHDGETWHQNIGPDAIMLTPIGPVLLGFAAAEHATAAARHTPAVALKPGFAAIEQYGGIAETTRGPWTDLYALAAVVYSAITGEEPAPAADRLADDRLAPLSNIAAGLYSERFLAAIDAALAVQPERRPRDHLQFRALMGDIETSERLELAPPLDLMQEPFAGAVKGNREITVPDGPLAATISAATISPAVSNSAKARVAARSTPAENAQLRPAERVFPSWMRVGRRTGAIGKRAAYGLVAVTCVLIGVAALTLDYYGRHVSHAPSLATPTAATTAPASATAATEIARISPAPAPPPAAPVASSRAPVAAPVVAVMTTHAAAVEAAPVPATIGRPLPALDPATPAERQARCLDILQKASLEPISAGETAYFKRECK